MLSPFHALYKARVLSNMARGKERFVPVFASSNIDVYPHQIAAAMFALRSPYLKGVILCDEGGLGKSYISLLTIVQKWYEGARDILLVLPAHLIGQWQDIFEERFSVPAFFVDNEKVFEQFSDGDNPFSQDGIVVTTYDFAYEKRDVITQINWTFAVFDEADVLCRTHTGESKMATALKESTKGAHKILLTPTPILTSIMDIYGLIYFIDETALPDADSFYKRYFRKPENYPELAQRVSKYCYRTLRSQVQTHIKIPNRIPITAEYSLTPKEQKLYVMIEEYLSKPEKVAFPKMEQYDLTLLFTRNFSSSTFAVAKTIKGVIERLEALKTESDSASALDVELAQFKQMADLADTITENAKGKELLSALRTGFAEMKRLGAQRKAVIFTENRETQRYVKRLLDEHGYKGKVLTYHGGKSRDYSIIKKFRDEATILLTTDLAAKGLNFEFCSFVINYDLPYNTLTLDQRINRCHRQGQQCDVVVLNFLNKNNFADVRMLELINKRILQFSGVFGMSDDVIGNFGVDVKRDFKDVLSNARTRTEIDKLFQDTLLLYEGENTQLVEKASESLFTSFSKEVADSVTVTPQYIEKAAQKANDDLWDITKYFFEGKQGYSCDDETRTVHIGIQPQKVFTGAHLGRREYSMTDKALPKSGHHTLTGTLTKNILNEMFWRGIPDTGSVVVDANIERCQIAYYQVRIKSKSDYFSAWYYYVFVGKTSSGRLLSHEECAEVMELPVVSFEKSGDIYGDRDGITKTKKAEELDALVSVDEYMQQTLTEADSATNEEIARISLQAADKKAELQRTIESLHSELSQLEGRVARQSTIAEKVQNEKQKSAVQKELRIREQQLFMDGMRLDLELEEQIKGLTEQAQLTAEVKRQFIIRVAPTELEEVS